VSSSAALALAAGLFACAGADATFVGDVEAGSPETGGGGVDGSPIEETDAATVGTDAADAAVTIIDGPGKAGDVCSFNRECNAALRCECTETEGCACKAGTRGTGKNGIDPCADGNVCASSLCVEGPPDSGSFCSEECKTSADCTGKLPLCSDIAFVGRICIRTPPS